MRTPPITLLLSLLLLLSACAGGDDPTVEVRDTPSADGRTSPTEAAPTPAPPATEDPDASPGPTAGATATATPGRTTSTVHLVREGGERLWVEPVAIEVSDPGDAVARAAIEALLAAPRTGPLVTLAPEGTRLLDIAIADGVLTVDVSEEVATNPGAGAATEEAFQQSLAHTAAQFPTVSSVRLRVEGAEVEELWGHLDWSTPFVADEFRISPIIITGAEVVAADGTGASSLELSGTANVFEAVFDIEVLDADGAQVAATFVMATCGTGCRGDWAETVTDLAPGTYTVVAREQEVGEEGEGPPPFLVTREVVIG